MKVGSASLSGLRGARRDRGFARPEALPTISLFPPVGCSGGPQIPRARHRIAQCPSKERYRTITLGSNRPEVAWRCERVAAPLLGCDPRGFKNNLNFCSFYTTEYRPVL